MKKIIKITKKDLDNYNKDMNIIADYPLYASTCGISRAEAIAIAKILDLGLQNDTELTITINIK